MPKTWKKVQKGHPIRKILTHPDKEWGEGEREEGGKRSRLTTKDLFIYNSLAVEPFQHA